MSETISDLLIGLEEARVNSISAIKAKGGSIDDSDGFESFPAAISNIPSGGGSSGDYSGKLLLDSTECGNITLFLYNEDEEFEDEPQPFLTSRYRQIVLYNLEENPVSSMTVIHSSLSDNVKFYFSGILGGVTYINIELDPNGDEFVPDAIMPPNSEYASWNLQEGDGGKITIKSLDKFIINAYNSEININAIVEQGTQQEESKTIDAGSVDDFYYPASGNTGEEFNIKFAATPSSDSKIHFTGTYNKQFYDKDLNTANTYILPPDNSTYANGSWRYLKLGDGVLQLTVVASEAVEENTFRIDNSASNIDLKLVWGNYKDWYSRYINAGNVETVDLSNFSYTYLLQGRYGYEPLNLLTAKLSGKYQGDTYNDYILDIIQIDMEGSLIYVVANPSGAEDWAPIDGDSVKITLSRD